MDLLEVRTLFVQTTGRYDLVVDVAAYADNGANAYINAGISLLDRLVEVPENTAKLFYPLAIGEYSIEFQHKARTIQEVYVNNTEDKWRLTKETEEKFREYYPDIVGDIDTGAPSMYTLSRLRALETTDKTTLGTFINPTHTEDETKYDYRGITVGPPTDAALTVEVIGIFEQNALSANGDENYWTLYDPILLIQAASYELENLSQGTERRKDWMSSIRLKAMEHDKDSVAEQIVDSDQMEG